MGLAPQPHPLMGSLGLLTYLLMGRQLCGVPAGLLSFLAAHSPLLIPHAVATGEGLLVQRGGKVACMPQSTEGPPPSACPEIPTQLPPCPCPLVSCWLFMYQKGKPNRLADAQSPRASAKTIETLPKLPTGQWVDRSLGMRREFTHTGL